MVALQKNNETNYGSIHSAPLHSVDIMCACACYAHILQGVNKDWTLQQVSSWDNHGTTCSSEGKPANTTNTRNFVIFGGVVAFTGPLIVWHSLQASFVLIH